MKIETSVTDITAQDAERAFYYALCNSYSTGYFNYGSLKYDDKLFEDAKIKLKQMDNPVCVDGSPMTSVCFEDILMQMLQDGGELKYVDNEDDSLNCTITLKDIHEKIHKVPTKHLIDFCNENDDAETGDVILQSILFGELIFG